MYTVISKGAGLLAVLGIALYSLALHMARSDGPEGVEIDHDVRLIVVAVIVSLVVIATTSWLDKITLRRAVARDIQPMINQEVRIQLAHLRADLQADIRIIVAAEIATAVTQIRTDLNAWQNEVTRPLAVVSPDSVSAINSGFRTEIEKALRTTADKAYRAAAVARATARVPAQSIGNVLPMPAHRREE